MADEPILQVRIEDPLPFTVADANFIAKGTVCALDDPRTATSGAGNGGVLAGIAARDKIASDGRTELAFFRRGWFDMLCSGAVTTGDTLQAYNNEVQVAGLDLSGASIIGTALQDGADNERILVDVNIQPGFNTD